jgi:type IV pilus assembly protein PilA
MKSTFTAKYLQHLNKKNGNKGFTLIELLVVIIIVGVLAAIALPSFLNQVGKARGSEAKSNLGVINRAQQSYRMENGVFAANLTDMDARVSGKFFGYEIDSANANSMVALTTTLEKELKPSAAAAAQNGENFASLICESSATAAANSTAAAPTGTTAPVAGDTNRQGDCAGNYVAVQ